MPRPLCLFTGQWADLPLEALAEKAAGFGYEGLELACWGDHFEVRQGALSRRRLLPEALARPARRVRASSCWAISEPPRRPGRLRPDRRAPQGDPPRARSGATAIPKAVRADARATEDMKNTARAARRFFDAAMAGVKVAPRDDRPNRRERARGKQHLVTSSTSSRPFDPARSTPASSDFAARWKPILDVFQQENVCFALEVHPTEIAFDIHSTRRALRAIDDHPAFGFNFDPSHLGYQGVDYLAFLREFSDRIWNVHVKDVWWSDRPSEAGVFGGHAPFGTDGRYWEFCSPGRGKIDFEGIIRQLNQAGYQGPLTVEWEDPGMHREHGATESVGFVRSLDFEVSPAAFDAAFSGD